MAKTFLEYLTLPNPSTNSEKCKEGKSQGSRTVYGPYEVQPWTDLTWENLDTSFGHVLRQKMPRPRVRNANDVDLEDTEIEQENSVTKLTGNWNEPVVRHALDRTRKMLEKLMTDYFKEYLDKGTLHVKTSTGKGNKKDKFGNTQKPDWYVYQKDKEKKVAHANLVPGESKPAKKWKLEWLESRNESEKKYGFLLSEEELVPVRLSTFNRESEAEEKPLEDYQEPQITEKRTSFRKEFEGDREYQDSEHQEIILGKDQCLAPPFSDPKNKVRTRLEYCRIPWAKKGVGALTINLALWWLPMLAIQDRSIKHVDDYIPLSVIVPARSSENNHQQTRENATGETQGDQEANSRKRKAENSERPERSSKSRRGSVNRSPANPTASSSNEPEQRQRSNRGNSSHESIFNQIFIPDQGSVAGPRRSARKNKGLGSYVSNASSSQATDVDDQYIISPNQSFAL
ncbi:hypothetical protein F4806DRAFT_503681 [Annulohypoxylon nitens]|nr:hypothetical protein F4806DRAFT_503681 [Annulohypoxylon nitens]